MSIFLFERDNEKSVIDNLRLLIQMSLKSIELLKDYMNSKDEKILKEIIKIEEEGDENYKKYKDKLRKGIFTKYEKRVIKVCRAFR